MVAVVPQPTGSPYAEVNAALVDAAERDAADAVLARVSRFLNLGHHVMPGGVRGWIPAVGLKWFDAVDPDHPPGPGTASWRASLGCWGCFVADEPDAIWVRRGQGVRGVVETTAHECMHAAQLMRQGRAFYAARFRADLLEDDARACGEEWLAFYDRYPDELRRSAR